MNMEELNQKAGKLFGILDRVVRHEMPEDEYKFLRVATLILVDMARDLKEIAYNTRKENR